MSKATESLKNAIKQYLDKRAAEDELFAKSYAKQNKNIDACCSFIMGEASKRGRAVCMSDEEVFGLAVHYYDEDDIKITPVHGNVSVSQQPQVELTEEEKAAAKERAEKAYEAKCIQQMEDAKKASAKKAAEKRKEANKNVLSLF